MSKAKFDATKELIREGQYTQARILLESIDHPQAKEWLKKLHDLEVNALKTVGVSPGSVKVSLEKPKRSKLRGCLYVVGAVVVLSAIGSALPRTPKAAVPTITPGGPTATITNTPKPTATATITNTPVPTATPSLQDQVQSVIDEAVGFADITRVSVIDVGSPKLLAVDFDMMQGFSGYEVDFTANKMLEMACALHQNGFAEDWQYQFSAMVDLIDRSTGKTSTDDGLTVRVKSSTVAGWDCANAALMDAERAVDDYILNPVMTK